jgi:type IV pilus assembly protein PilX
MYKQKQNGVVIIVALIVLVAMTLGGIALIRSMDSTTMIAGNMAYQQTTIASADAGIESAIVWLETKKSGIVLQQNFTDVGYTASTAALLANQNGEVFWNAFSNSGICILPRNGDVCTQAPGIPDSAGNIISFMIQRICTGTGARNGNACATSQMTASTTDGESQGAGEDSLAPVSNNFYYRITARVTGPRNTVSYIQAIVSM